MNIYIYILTYIYMIYIYIYMYMIYIYIYIYHIYNVLCTDRGGGNFDSYDVNLSTEQNIVEYISFLIRFDFSQCLKFL